MGVSVLPVTAFSCVLLTATCYVVYHAWQGYETYSPYYLSSLVLLTGFLGFASFMSWLFTIQINDRLISESHTTFTAFIHFMFTRVLLFVGRHWTMKSLEEDTKKASKSQETFLEELLSENANTEYGQSYSFSEIKNKTDFVEKVPLSTYENYKAPIKKIADKGVQNVLTKENATYLSMTAGTTGPPTVVPTTVTSMSIYIKEFSVTANYVVACEFPTTTKLQKSLMLTFPNQISLTKGGLAMGPISGTSSDDSHLMWLLQTTPKLVLGIRDEKKIMYVHMLFALADKNLSKITSNYSSTVLSMFVALETHWRQLILDVESGKVSSKSAISLDVRRELNKLLVPSPRRAEELRKEFEKGFSGIADRIWPSMAVIVAGDSGIAAHYGRLIRQKYVKDIPIYSSIYGAAECGLGVNISPRKERSEFVLRTRANFYEFIPIEEADDPAPKTLFLDEVELGEEYEVVVTTMGGLYRYRLGDVVEVSGFYNNCPVVVYRYRRGQTLNLTGEKTTEETLSKAVLETVDSWDGVQLIDFTSTESVHMSGHDMDEKSPCYVVFLEIQAQDQKVGIDVTEEQKETFDKILRKHSATYDSRRDDCIAPPRVFIVKNGAFTALGEYLMKMNPTSYNQVKIPRVLTCAEHIGVLMKHVG